MDVIHWALIIVVIVLVCNRVEDNQTAYEKGYRKGYAEGRKYEHGLGRERYYQRGYEDGLQEGKQHNNKKAYQPEAVKTEPDCCEELESQ